MEFYGDTLSEAFGRAFGRRPNTQIEKKYASMSVSRGANIESLRYRAITRAKNYIRNSDVSIGADEDGYMEIYFPDRGRIHMYQASEAGRGSGGEFEFVFRRSMEGGEVLVTAHSHPLLDESASGYDRVLRNRRDQQNDGPSTDDNRRLSRLAPMIILGPNGNPPEDFGNPPYRSVRQHPNYRSPRKKK